MNEQELVRELESSGALKRGHFRLSSGLHSDTYIQCALLLSEPRAAVEVGRELASRVDRNVDVVACPALGGIVIGFTVAMALGVPMVFSERVEGTMRLRRGFWMERGSRVLLVEDVVTTGGSIMELAGLVEEVGATVESLGCIVDRGGIQQDRYPLVSLLRLQVEAFQPDKCPICEKGHPLDSPGSRYEG